MEERELAKDKKTVGEEDPFYRSPQIQPLPVLDAYEQYYRSCERYYRLSGSSSQQQATTRNWSGSAAPSGTTVHPSGTTAKPKRATETCTLCETQAVEQR